MAKAKPAWSKDMIVPAQSARRVVKGPFGRFSDPAPPEIEADPWMRLAWYAPHEALRQMEKWKCEQLDGGLIHFIRLMWHIVEPERPLVEGWVLHAICEHLEAVSKGKINRLLINVPPGSTKSLCADVFFPAWEWGPLNRPSLRYMCASYTSDLTRRDNRRFRSLVTSDLFMKYWGKNVIVDGLNEIRVGNDKTGWKLATSVGGTGTGERADRVILDDANNPLESESPTIMRNTEIWFREVIPDRLNSLDDSAIINIQQRTNEGDVSGIILENELPYVHLMIPMEYDPTRFYVNEIGWKDPRGLDEYGNVLPEAELQAQAGALAWPERFSAAALADLSRAKGEYAWNGQYQQSPAPRGGGIFKRAWLEPWPPMNEDGEIPVGSIVNTYDGRPATQADYDRQQAKILYPALEYIVGSVDTAHTAREENDFCAMVVLGVFRAEGQGRIERTQNPETGQIQYVRIADDVGFSKVLLLHGWMKRLTLHGPPEQIPPGVDLKTWNSPRYLPERQKTWGLVEWTHWTATKYKIDHLIIETQAVGHALDDELHRLHSDSVWSVELKPALGDKIARGYRVQGLLSSGQVYVPTYPDGTYPMWCTPIVDQLAVFPKGKHDDAVDACLIAETPIITQRGAINICDLVVGDVVMTHRGRWRRVTSVGSRIAKERFRIKAKCLDAIEVTGEHPFLTLPVIFSQSKFLPKRRSGSPTWKPASWLRERATYTFLRNGKRVASQKRLDYDCVVLPRPRRETSCNWLDMSEFAPSGSCADDTLIFCDRPTWSKLSEQQVIAVASKKGTASIAAIAREFAVSEPIVSMIWKNQRRGPKVMSIPRYVQLTNEAGWAFGLFAAEGCVSGNHVLWSCDGEAIRRVQKWASSTFQCHVGLADGQGAKVTLLSNFMIAPLFRTFGYLAKNKIVPSWVFEAPDEFILGFVEGFTHGDGSFSKRRPNDETTVVALTSTSDSLLWGIRLLLARLGIQSSRGTGKQAGIRMIKGRACNCQHAYRVDYPIGGENRSVTMHEEFIGFHIEKIERIEEECEVFNLTVEEDESYLTAGGIVHNCTQGLAHLRDIGIFERRGEYESALAESLVWKPSQGRIMLPYDL